MQLAERPRLELSGPKLKLAFEALVARADEQGGVEAYVEALKIKCGLFRDTLEAPLDLKALRTLCAHMATVRRRIGRYAEPEFFPQMSTRIGALLASAADTASADARVAQFCAAFPEDREHRWVRDLAAELLHYGDPERYPLMTRWIWDERANTGVIREIWHAEDVDQIRIELADGYATFLMLREELAQYLAANGVFRDVLFYVDVLMAQIYAGYIGERGGSYLRADFATPEDPMLHTRRILGLDGVDQRGRSRLKAADGRAEVIK
ncbi:MAG TPA: hypothetical protein VFJ70_16530 [Burkholderiales bacterium]|nr:hypothetical protein [Burkholderiales bacterium]